MVRICRFLLLILFCCPALSHAQSDIRILRKFYTPGPLSSDHFFKFTSNTVTPVSIAIPVSYASAALLYPKKSRARKINLQRSLQSSLCMLGSGMVSYSLKFTIKRPRPAETYPDIIPKTNPSTHAFPSGHTTFAFASATTLTLNHKKWYVAVPAYLWAGTIAYSRLHLGAHYPSDVLAGAVIGTGTSILMHYLSKKLFR